MDIQFLMAAFLDCLSYGDDVQKRAEAAKLAIRIAHHLTKGGALPEVWQVRPGVYSVPSETAAA